MLGPLVVGCAAFRLEDDGTAAAVVALATACGFMWVAAKKVGLDGNPFGIQKAGGVRLQAARK